MEFSRSKDIAVLVLAHANPGVFERLVRALSHPSIAIFCHIDAKADLAAFRTPSCAGVVFLEERVDINWGGYSMIEAELALFRAGRRAGPFAAYAVISSAPASLSADPDFAGVGTWPHDMAFVATVLAHAGFLCRDLNETGPPCYNDDSLRLTPLHDRAALADMPMDGLIYYPVRSFEAKNPPASSSWISTSGSMSQYASYAGRAARTT
jgi:hypothetical protein